MIVNEKWLKLDNLWEQIERRRIVRADKLKRLGFKRQWHSVPIGETGEKTALAVYYRVENGIVQYMRDDYVQFMPNAVYANHLEGVLCGFSMSNE